MGNKKYIFCYFIALIWIPSVYSDVALTGSCNIQEITKDEWERYKSIPLSDTRSPGIIETWTIVDNTVTGIVSAPNPNTCNECFEFVITEDKKSIQFKVKDSYKNLEKDNDSTSLSITIKFNCDDKSTADIMLIITLDLSNGYAPEIEQGEYSLTLPMPLGKDMKIGLLSDDYIIRATDYDIGNKGITFKLDPAGFFAIDSEVVPDTLQKTYRGILRTLQAIDFKEDKSFKLIAIDNPGSQGAAKHTESQLKIIIDKTNSKIPTPIFKKPLYDGKYKVKDNSFDTVQIELDGDYGSYKPEYNIETSDVSEYFELEPTTANLKKKTNLPTEIVQKYNSIAVVITATIKGDEQNKETGKTAVKIDIEKEAIPSPEFRKQVYNGKYTKDKTLEFTEKIELTNEIAAYKPKFTLKPEIKGLEEYIALDESTMTIILKDKSKPIDENLIKGMNNIILLVEATISVDGKDETGKTVIDIAIERQDVPPPTFIKDVYNGKYTKDKTIEFPEKIELTNKNSEYKPKFTLKPEVPGLEDYIALDESTMTIILKDKTKPIDENLIKGMNNIILFVEATISVDDKDETGKTVIDIAIERQDVPQPTFIKDVYNGKYTKDKTIEFPEKIQLSNENSEYKPKFTLKPEVPGVEEYIALDESTMTIILKDKTKPIDENLIKGMNNIILLVEATISVDGKDETGKTVIDIAIERQDVPPPTFIKDLYNGKYTKDKTIEFPEKIELTNKNSEYKPKFTLKPEVPGLEDYIALDESTMTIILKDKTKPIDENLIKGMNNIILFVEATISVEGKDATGKTVIDIAIERQDVPPPTFIKDVYNGKYTKDKIIDFPEKIQLSNENSEYKPKFTLKPEVPGLEEYIALDESTMTIILKDKTKPIDENLIKGMNNIILFVEATISVDDKDETGKTVIDIAIERQDVPPPTFKKDVYNGKYTKDKTIEFPEKIQLSNENSEYKPKFTLKPEVPGLEQYIALDESTMTIILKDKTKPIDENLIKGMNNIILFVEATISVDDKDETGKTVIDIAIERQDVPPPTFKKDVYNGKYTKDKTIEFPEKIQLSNENSEYKPKFTLKPEVPGLEEYIALDESTMTIILKDKTKPIDENLIKGMNNIILFVEATISVDDKDETGKTVIDIAIERQDVPPPTFKKDVYNGKYTKDKTIEFPEKIQLSNENSEYKPKFTLNPEVPGLEEYIALDESTMTIILKDKTKPIDENLIKGMNNIILFVEATISVDDKDETGKTVIDIAIERQDADAPGFKQEVYNGKYTKDKKLEFPDKIGLTNDNPEYKPVFALKPETPGLEKYLNLDEATMTIVLKDGKPIDEDLIKGKNNIILVLEATISINGKNEIGKTTINIAIERKDADVPEFTKEVYNGQYTKDKKLEFLKKIELTNENSEYKPVFALKPEIAGLEQYLTLDENTMTIILIDDKPIDEDLIKGINNIILVLEATISINGKDETGKTTINIAIERKDALEPEFKKEIYSGKYTKDKKLEFPDKIELTNENPEYKPVFTLKAGTTGLDKYLTLDEATMTIVLKDGNPIDEELIKEKNNIILVLEAKISINGKDLTGKTTVNIEIERKDADVPKFKQEVYNGKYTKDQKLEFPDKIELINDNPETKPVFTLKPEIAGLENYIILDETTMTIVLKDGKPIDETLIKGKSNIILVLEATISINGKDITGKTTINIAIERKDALEPEFKKEVYSGKYTKDKKLEFPDKIELTNENPEYKPVFTLKAGTTELDKYLALDEATMSIILKDGNPIDEELIKGKNNIILVLEAKISINGKDLKVKTTVNIEIERKDTCGSTTTEMSTTTNGQTESSTSNTTPNDCPTVGPGSLYYPKNFYHYEEKDDYVGTIDIIEALLVNSDENDIQYSFDANENIKSRIVYGPIVPALKLTEAVPSGVYHIILTAKTGTTEKKTQAIVKLTISGTVQKCDDWTIVQDKLVALKLKENEEHVLYLLEGKEADKYKLEISKQIPDNKEWFTLNKEATNLIINKIADREDPSIANQPFPQAQVWIHVLEKTQNPRYKREESHYVNTNNIPNEPGLMVINVILDDENDNSPIFDKKSILVGYPGPKVSKNVAPPYVVQVKATDLDTGDNAKITYSLNNKNFVVDEEGRISPGNGAFDNDEDEIITVSAKDNGEPAKTSESDMTVTVKVLQDQHISILVVKGKSYSELDTYFDDLNKNSKDVMFGYLSATAVASSDDKNDDSRMVDTYADATDDQIALRIVIYAIDTKNKNTPMTTDQLKGALPSASDGEVVGNYKETTEQESCNTIYVCDETGWIAAVSVLAVLLVILIVAIIIVYFRIIKPRMLDLVMETRPFDTKFEKKKTTLTEIEEKKKSLEHRRPTGFPKDFHPRRLEEELDDDSIVDENDNKERDPEDGLKTINNIDTSFNVDEEDDYKNKDDDDNDKKKVMFNEVVEEIHTITVL